ncbi:unnamed protein product [Macrosiphum euphorbiae]|uniref:Uncharacterized protein n=1 Tax=Macrosiphum euphorbiae TaxID=13131 RepID=A0AAV0XS89_9HEMI|nr:unnamed protein product [Macrosiphum euphorbiae]
MASDPLIAIYVFETQHCYVQTRLNQPHRVSVPLAFKVRTPIRVVAVGRKLRARATVPVFSVLSTSRSERMTSCLACIVLSLATGLSLYPLVRSL